MGRQKIVGSWHEGEKCEPGEKQSGLLKGRKNFLAVPFAVLHVALGKALSCLVLTVGQESHHASQAEVASRPWQSWGLAGCGLHGLAAEAHFLFVAPANYLWLCNRKKSCSCLADSFKNLKRRIIKVDWCTSNVPLIKNIYRYIY